jgi:hypothetical protein
LSLLFFKGAKNYVPLFSERGKNAFPLFQRGKKFVPLLKGKKYVLLLKGKKYVPPLKGKKYVPPFFKGGLGGIGGTMRSSPSVI